MTSVTLPQAQAIARKQYEAIAKKMKPGSNIARRSDWITRRAEMIMQNGPDAVEMRMLENLK
jgi:hypothetical protein